MVRAAAARLSSGPSGSGIGCGWLLAAWRKALTKSRAERKRSSGCLASWRLTTASTAGGSSGRIERSGGGGLWTWAYMIAGVFAPANGVRPASSSYATTPSAYRSAGTPAPSPRSISGAM